jgi:alkanesulfonate monooxygenase SsuD/methylene tetrahydromethanopterin reductase-like flavin-dependent oxidoreductase (luciferase family)
MEVGIQTMWSSYGWDGLSDEQVYADELRLALQAEELGFDTVWAVEHHFFDYAFCPDNVALLSYLAARTSTIKLGTAAVILPWNDPLRVAERISLLDVLSGGRVKFGMGRGLSRREFAHFHGIGMDEARGRFDEASRIIVDALHTGVIEADGQYYTIPRTEIRPRTSHSWEGRVYAVAGSPDSVTACAAAKAQMLLFGEKHWEARLPGLQQYRQQYEERWNEPAPGPLTVDLVFCDVDEKKAKAVAERSLTAYLNSILEHYEVMGDHFGDTPGYKEYAQGAEHLRQVGFEGYLENFLAANAYGTPDQLLEHFRNRREVIGPFELAVSFRFGGLPVELGDSAMRLFATEVLPELHSW